MHSSHRTWPKPKPELLLMDTYFPGNLPTPDGRITEVNHRFVSQNAWQNGSFYKVPYTQLTATSNYFRRITAPNEGVAKITYPDREILEIYLEWTKTRIIRRRVGGVASPIHHSKPSRPSKIRKLANGVAQAAANDADGTKVLDGFPLAVDYETLISLWTLCIHIQDSTLADTVMSILRNTVYTPENDLEVFFATITPQLVAPLYPNKAADRIIGLCLNNMIGFIIVTISQFASPKRIATFLADTSFTQDFLTLLNKQLVACVPVHLLPDGVDLPHSKMVRIALPLPPFRRAKGWEEEAWRQREEYWTTRSWSGNELQERAVTALWMGFTPCQYHLHQGYVPCWGSQFYTTALPPVSASARTPVPADMDLPPAFWDQLGRVD